MTTAEIRTPSMSFETDAAPFCLQLSMYAGSFSQISQFFFKKKNNFYKYKFSKFAISGISGIFRVPGAPGVPGVSWLFDTKLNNDGGPLNNGEGPLNHEGQIPYHDGGATQSGGSTSQSQQRHRRNPV